MGMNVMSGSSSDSKTVIFKPDPGPWNYEILKYYKVNNFLILEIQYKDVDNYEGKKILVYENTTIDDLIKQVKIDPHFCESDDVFSPVARFEPTERGKKWAHSFAAVNWHG